MQDSNYSQYYPQNNSGVGGQRQMQQQTQIPQLQPQQTQRPYQPGGMANQPQQMQMPQMQMPQMQMPQMQMPYQPPQTQRPYQPTPYSHAEYQQSQRPQWEELRRERQKERERKEGIAEIRRGPDMSDQRIQPWVNPPDYASLNETQQGQYGSWYDGLTSGRPGWGGNRPDTSWNAFSEHLRGIERPRRPYVLKEGHGQDRPR